MTTSAGAQVEPAVLVVGAGPTGLTLACELARRDISFRLVESSPGPQVGSRGKGLQPRTLEVFEDLGVIDQILANGQLAMPIRVHAPDGQVTHGGAEPEALKDRPDIPFTTSLLTPQWRVEEALRGRLADLGGLVEFGVSVTGFVQTEDGVEATIEQDGVSTSVTARWLIACDGGRSTVRRQAGIEFVGDTRESVRMLIADVRVDGLDREAWHMWRHAEGLVSLCPLPSTDLFQLQSAVAPEQDTSLDIANLQAVLDARAGRRDITLSEPSWTSLWRANVRLVSRYRDGAMLLAGDAAHVHSPAGGQGMNTGIQDAYNLGWKLAAVLRGAPAALVDSYEAERRPVAAGVLALSDERLRQTLEQHAVPFTRDVDTTQLGVSYRGGSLARDDRADESALRAGDRAPDATHLRSVDGEHRLFDLLRGPQFTVLDFGSGRAADSWPREVQVLEVVGRPRVAGQVADTGGHLARAYASTERTIVLIRPDGYIAAIRDDGQPAEIEKQLASFSR